LNWYNPENLSFIIQWVALGCFLAALLVFVFWVALPVHRLVSKLAAYAEARGDVLPGALKNDVDTLNHVFKYLTEDLRKKEDALRGMVEQARTRVRFMERYNDRLVESVPVALLGFDGSGRLASVNSTAERIFYVRAADVLGKGAEVFWSSLPEGLDWVGAPFWAATDPRARGQMGLADGGVLGGGTQWRASPRRGGEGRGYVVAVFDRTPLRRLEEQPA
jgi:nitrogen fixation/metabolism regulation signal transduction histidine kinase